MPRIFHIQFSILLFILFQLASGQEVRRDVGIFSERKHEYLDKITATADSFLKEEKKPSREFMMDFSGMDLPRSKDEFQILWHTDRFSQGFIRHVLVFLYDLLF